MAWIVLGLVCFAFGGIFAGGVFLLCRRFMGMDAADHE